MRVTLTALAICCCMLLGGCDNFFGTKIISNRGEDASSSEEQPSVAEPTRTITPNAPDSQPDPQELRLAEARAMLADMPQEAKIGQLFFIRCPDIDAAATIEKYQPGGCILFGRDFKGFSPEQVKANIASYQAESKIPLLVGTDEEGGEVCRVSSYSQFRSARFPSPQRLFKAGGLEEVRSDTTEKAKLLTGLGVNVNFAPVCDVSTSRSDYINGRSFGKSGKETSEYVRTVVEEANENNLGSVLKHFPGYGPNADTHTGYTIDKRAYETFLGDDFLPFEAGIAAGAGCVLVGHNIVECMDAELPASLSPKVHAILRDELEFKGVTITDDLLMDAISQQFGICDAAVLAIVAGNDMILSSDLPTQYEAITAAVNDGTITQQRLDDAVTRVLAWKLTLMMI